MRIGNRSGQARQSAGIGVSATVAAVVLVMIVSPVAGAATTTHPWKKSQATLSTGISKSGCAAAKQQTPAWSAPTGRFSWSGSAKALSCVANSTSLSDNEAVVQASEVIYVPLKIGHSGPHTIIANVSLAASVSNTFARGTCKAPSGSKYGFCTQSTSAQLVTFVAIVDTTSGSSYQTTSRLPSVAVGTSYDSDLNGGVWTNSSSGGPGIKNLSTTAHLWWNISRMFWFDHYQLEFGWSTYVGAGGTSNGAFLRGFSGSAKVDLSAHGNGGTLISIYVS